MKQYKNTLLFKSYRLLKQFRSFLLHRRGDGVHSPYAFHLITKIIRNPHPYDCFRRLRSELDKKIKYIKQKLHPHIIYQTYTAELIFRLSSHHRARRVLLLSSYVDSILKPYLQATGKVKEIIELDDLNAQLNFNKKELSMIIIEDFQEKNLEQLKNLLAELLKYNSKDLMIIFNTENPLVRSQVKALDNILSPQIRFSLQRLELFVWRHHTTPGRYNVFA